MWLIINSYAPFYQNTNIMKIAIYLSGISGSLLLLIRTIGIIMEFPLNKVFLILGLILLLFIFIPLIFIDKYHNKKKIDRIIDSYKGKENKNSQLEKGDSKNKGWGMNNSPFRERKSGLTWGGGNIKGANASRGTRKSFLK
jgi:energy-coupling factor transporter transmembrane protein EcfT